MQKNCICKTKNNFSSVLINLIELYNVESNKLHHQEVTQFRCVEDYRVLSATEICILKY